MSNFYQQGLQEYLECNRSLAKAMNGVNDNLTSMFEGLEVSMIDLASKLEEATLKAANMDSELGTEAALFKVEPKDDDPEQLENSMFRDVPPEIKAAAKEAGIGVEDLIELALKFVDKRNEAKHKRREQKNDIKLEMKKLKNKAIQRDLDVDIARVRWQSFETFSKNINTVATAAVKWGSMAAGASFIAYFITNIFVG